MRGILALYAALGILNFLDLALGRKIFYHEKISAITKGRFSVFAVAMFVAFQAFSVGLSLYFFYGSSAVKGVLYLLIAVMPFVLSPFSSGRCRSCSSTCSSTPG